MASRLFVLCAIGFAHTAPASADTWSSYAAVQCRPEAVVIRNGGHYDADPPALYDLPAPHAGEWDGVPIDADGRCTLATGETVLVRIGWGESRLTGPGSLAPPTWVSVWINGRKVLSRETVQSGYAASFTGPFLNSLFITRDGVERCAYRDGLLIPGDEDPAGVVCTSRSIELSEIPVDPLESLVEAHASPWTFAATYSPEFCASFIRTRGAVVPNTPDAFGDELIIAPPAEATYPFPGDAHPIDGDDVQIAHLDYFNNGNLRIGVRMWLEDAWYQRNNYFFLGPDKVDQAAVDAFTTAAREAINARSIHDFDPLALSKQWWTPLSDGAAPSQRIFRLADTTFYLTGAPWPSTAILVVRPGMHPARTETICTFVRRQPNY